MDDSLARTEPPVWDTVLVNANGKLGVFMSKGGSPTGSALSPTLLHVCGRRQLALRPSPPQNCSVVLTDRRERFGLFLRDRDVASRT
ncbi:hypothetical protein ID875_06000 [Streptomyces globisporus]|uniref:Uncharacterized protein n=1 Tax=Streptomyces globisporus TaxID=1908 RepID=A0A927BJR7_STRGL|nr:hypothetical protein [Streptomyces globisporus]